MSINDYTFSAACAITVQIMLGISFLVLAAASLATLYKVLVKPKELTDKLLEQGEERSFIAPLYYFLLLLHSLVMCFYSFIYSFQSIKNYTNDGVSDEQQLEKSFNNGLYISDAIFFVLFIIMLSQMVLYNEFGHIYKGSQYFDNIFTKRTYQMPKEIIIVLGGYSFIQLIIIILYNVNVIKSPLLNFIDMTLNLSQPMLQITYEIYTNRRFQGCPIKSKKIEQQIRQLRSLLVFFSIGRVFQGIINGFLIFEENLIVFVLQSDSKSWVVYAVIAGYALDELLFQIIPFIMTFSKEIMKILWKQFKTASLLQLDRDSPEIQLKENGALDLSNDSETQLDQRRYTVSDQNDRGIIELQTSEFKITEQFQSQSISNVQFGTLHKCIFNNPRYTGKQFIVRRISALRLSQYLLEEINADLQTYRKLNNQQILSIKAMAIDKEYVYFMIPYLNNGSLGSIIYGKSALPSVTLDVKFQLLKNITEGMLYLHNANIYHGSLKSNNILLSKSMTGKIVDYGLHPFKKFISLTTGYTTKSQYTAPEKLLDRSSTPVATAEADVYAFGMITWEIFHMKQAFPGLSIQELTKLIATEQKRPKIDESIPEDIQTLIRACWQNDLNKRPTFHKVQLFLDGSLQNL